jgi:Domain of unknown function (DUF1917)
MVGYLFFIQNKKPGQTDTKLLGDDHQREQLEQDAATFGKEEYDTFWDYSTRSINVIVLRSKNLASMAHIGGSKRKSETPQLFNYYEGRSKSAWQLDETVDDFLKRLPPVGHDNFSGPWIYIANPWEREESYTGYEQSEYAELIARGKELLQAYEDKIKFSIEKKAARRSGPETADSEELKKDLFKLASKCKLTAGKVSYKGASGLCFCSADFLVDVLRSRR